MSSRTADSKIPTTKSLITVIGPIGSGKTTVAKLLAEKLRLPLLDADLFEDNPFLPGFIKDPHRYAFSVELFFTIKRLKKLKPISSLLKKSSVVIDSGLIMSRIYTQNQYRQGYLTPAEWDFYQEIVADYQTALPNPDIIVYLKTKPATQLARIRARGRNFETGYTIGYLTQITDRLEEYVSVIDQQKTKLITIDTDKVNLLEEEVQQKLIKKMKSN